MNRALPLLVALLAAPAAASPRGDCYYERGTFIVVHEGQVHRRSVDTYDRALVECSGGVSAIYDGDDLIVFDPERGRFESQGVDDAYAGARLSVSDGLAILYDGDDLIVYDARTGRFDAHWADDGVAVAEVIAGRDGAMAWDGDDLYAYCPSARRWTSSWDGKDGASATGVRERGGGVALLIDGKRHGLDPRACRIAEDAAGRGLTCRYDGDEFLVSYEGTRYSWNADDSFPGAPVSCGVEVAALYDGDDLVVFEGQGRSFRTWNAENGSIKAAVVAGRTAVLGYDGDDAVAWCRGQWLTASAPDQADAAPGGSRWGRWLSLRVGSSQFVLDSETCRLESR